MKITKIGGFAKPTHRVAAYCRVSTDKTDQQESFETQRRYYTELIKSNPSWEMVGIYAYERRSGTAVSHRPEFLAMMETARGGEIDIILVKSISRFARNAAECQEYARELKALHVEVRFEREGISNMDSYADFIFSVLATVAQEESHSISENVRWTYQKNFEQGVYHIGDNRILGYDMGKDGKLTPNEDAWIVKRVFEGYASGMNLERTAADLNAAGAHRLRSDKPFDSATVLRILRNETYVGDLHLQKQAPTDYLTKRPKKYVSYTTYLVVDEHEGIVGRELWNRAKERIDAADAEHANGVYRNGLASHYLYGIVFCAQCGSPMVRRTYLNRKKEDYKAWNCRGRQHKNGCTNPMIHETDLLEELEQAMDRRGIPVAEGIPATHGVPAKGDETDGTVEARIIKNIRRVDVGPESILITFAGDEGETGDVRDAVEENVT